MSLLLSVVVREMKRVVKRGFTVYRNTNMNTKRLLIQNNNNHLSSSLKIVVDYFKMTTYAYVHNNSSYLVILTNSADNAGTFGRVSQPPGC